MPFGKSYYQLKVGWRSMNIFQNNNVIEKLSNEQIISPKFGYKDFESIL